MDNLTRDELLGALGAHVQWLFAVVSYSTPEEHRANRAQILERLKRAMEIAAKLPD